MAMVVLGFTIGTASPLGASWVAGLPRRLQCVPMCDECYWMEVVSLLQHLRDPGDHGGHGWWGGDTTKCG
jgi:hypothetical protein